MKDYILDNPNVFIRSDVLMSVSAMEKVSGFNMPCEVEGKVHDGGVVNATWSRETGGYLNIIETQNDIVVAELGVRGVASTLWPEEYDGPRVMTGVMSFAHTPKFMDVLKGVKNSVPSPKQIDKKASRLLGRLLIVVAKEFQKNEAGSV